MLKKLAFGQYIHKNSAIHKLDARVKILSVFLLSLFASTIKSYDKMAILTFFVIFTVMLAKIGIIRLIKSLKPFFYMYLFIILMYTLFSKNQLLIGILTVWKFALFVVIGAILTFTTTITSLTNAIEKLLMPLKFFGINQRNVSLLLSLAIRFIPSFFLYAEKIKDARVSRLGAFKIRHLNLLVAPLMERLFKTASTVSEAMLSRNYSSKRKKQNCNGHKLRW
ncbi:energy-coupling factor transporter transmembrane protein EcfT [Candidatus Woesearchaeota archaeon]|nr:energy-coupling factor transporter transmembrane protein EcfT [Candidatus Woesearchaeota archaeon]